MELVISEYDITAAGAVLHLTSAVGFTFLSLDIARFPIYLLATYSGFNIAIDKTLGVWALTLGLRCY